MTEVDQSPNQNLYKDLNTTLKILAHSAIIDLDLIFNSFIKYISCTVIHHHELIILGFLVYDTPTSILVKRNELEFESYMYSDSRLMLTEGNISLLKRKILFNDYSKSGDDSGWNNDTAHDTYDNRHS